ncbi:MAG: uracil phosphoribosyltransferase [Bacteroidia bacterium]|nr:MAG: uracil phosphoribosyltransferase [Bacteroidia bacterium]
MIHNLSQSDSIINQYLSEIRDINIQKDSWRFRKNLERIGQLIAFEISKELEYKPIPVTTPLGIADSKVLAQQPVIATILRAGLPLHMGILDVFDKAENAFISAYRRHHKDHSFDIALEYVSCPPLDNKTLILCDPMLATGSSMVLTFKSLLNHGKPKHTHIVCAIASKQGIDYVKKNMPDVNYTLWCGAIDDELTSTAYIVPGLGDAGDLAFGEKM